MIRHHFTVDDLIRLSEEARVKAYELGQMGAAVAAIRELGILTGHRIERRDMRVTHEHELSDAELLAIARQALQPKPLELEAVGRTGRTNGADQAAAPDGVDDGVEQDATWTKRDITRR